jgi:hypothetical protein
MTTERNRWSTRIICCFWSTRDHFRLLWIRRARLSTLTPGRKFRGRRQFPRLTSMAEPSFQDRPTTYMFFQRSESRCSQTQASRVTEQMFIEPYIGGRRSGAIEMLKQRLLFYSRTFSNLRFKPPLVWPSLSSIRALLAWSVPPTWSHSSASMSTNLKTPPSRCPHLRRPETHEAERYDRCRECFPAGARQRSRSSTV